MLNRWRRGEVAAADLALTPPRWRMPLVMLLLAGLFVLSVVSVTESFDEVSAGTDLPRLELPPIAGLELAEAEARLADLGFSVNVEMQPSEGTPRGIAVGQRPETGSKVEQGDIVTILVSDGESGQPLPDLTGRQASDAQTTLVSGGYAVAFVPVPSETIPPGEVISMAPAPGKRIVDGGAVTLSISSGPAPRVVPALAGRPITEVMIDLGRGGLGIGTITKTTKSDLPQGTVIESDPPAGAEVPRDFPVKLTVVGPPVTVKVPYLVGARQASAESALDSAGLSAQVIVKTVPAGDPNDGKVTAQSVPGGAPLSPGASVQITVSTSGAPPPPTAPMIPTTIAPPPGG